MQLPVQITDRNMEPSEAVTTRIEAEAAKLETFCNMVSGRAVRKMIRCFLQR